MGEKQSKVDSPEIISIGEQCGIEFGDGQVISGSLVVEEPKYKYDTEFEVVATPSGWRQVKQGQKIQPERRVDRVRGT